MDASGNSVAPFAIDQGVVKIINARIAGANIDNLVVGTSNITPGSVTKTEYWAQTGSASSFTTDVVFNHGLAVDQANRFLLELNIQWTLSVGGSTGVLNVPLVLEDVTTGSAVPLISKSITVYGPATDKPYTSYGPDFTLLTIPADRATTTIRYRGGSAGPASFSNCKIVGKVNKV